MNQATTKTEREYLPAFNYAQRNGYAGTLAQYVDEQYETYAETCRNNGICPMTRAMWETK